MTSPAPSGPQPSRIPAPPWRGLARAEWAMLALYAATTAFVAWQQLHLGHVNNFLTFRGGWVHLRSGENAYAAYPPLDYFKYSPTFALLMGPFAILPLWLGVLLFDAANVFLLYWAVRRLLPGSRGLVALALLYFEVLRTTQNTQINAALTALMVLTFLAIERERQVRGALALALGTLIKVFPLAAAACAIAHRRRARFFLVFGATLVALLLVPLVVTGPTALLQQYRWWTGLMASDVANSRLDSVMALLNLVVPGRWPNWPVQAAGTLLVLLPLAVRRDRWDDPSFRRRMLASLLAYVILFNHRTESPTFVVGMTGVVLWYLDGPRHWYHHAVMAFALVGVSLSSEVLPAGVLDVCCRPYHYKIVPILLAWLVMLWELLAPGRRPAAPGLASTA